MEKEFEREKLYVIDKVSLKDDVVFMTLHNIRNEMIKCKLLFDDYYNYSLNSKEFIDIDTVKKIQKEELSVFAYRNALNRLAIKDYSVHQMKESLRKKYEISENDLNEIIKKLKNQKLLDDEKYTISRINYLSNSLLSFKQIKQKLINDGIHKDIIEKHLINSTDELSKAKRKAEKYLLSIKGKSLNAKKQAILNKLLNDGFKTEDSKKAVAELDFSNDILLEDDLLKLERDKAYRKYSKKYEGYELKNKIYSFLVLKGFNYDAISEVINEMEF